MPKKEKKNKTKKATTLQLKSQRKNKNKNWLKFPHFTSILGKNRGILEDINVNI